MKVYVTCHESAYDPENSAVWTLSEVPDEEGWETDSGNDGYGLTKEKAEYYAKCINKFYFMEKAEKLAEAMRNFTMKDTEPTSGITVLMKGEEERQLKLFKKYRDFFKAAEIELPPDVFKKVVDRMKFNEIMNQPPQE